MADVTQVHEEKETLAVDVFIPGHEERTTTPLFLHTRQQLIAREGGRCYICGRNAEEAGHPLEAHHHPVERSMANMMDWERIKPLFPHFDWAAFDPANPYSFVDDMTVNGMLLCKDHHTGKGLGIHDLPYPLWISQKYGRAGYQFTAAEIICHADEPSDNERKV